MFILNKKINLNINDGKLKYFKSSARVFFLLNTYDKSYHTLETEKRQVLMSGMGLMPIPIPIPGIPEYIET